MKRILIPALLALAVSVPNSYAENPVWLQGKTDQAYKIEVYHSPTCGCCKGWIKHLEDHNFEVASIEMDDVSPIKQRLGVPARGASCHTAVVDGKVIEGHVPAQEIKTLLADKASNVRLLTVPGMPSGGPGMDMPGARKDPFTVFAIDTDNKVSEFKHYESY